MLRIACATFSLLAVVSASAIPLHLQGTKEVKIVPIKQPERWIKLFNGENLDGWTPKIKGHKLGENYANTFRVEDGVIKVSYDGYNGKFAEQYGHLFYKVPYKNYRFRMKYRFLGEQVADGPGWAWRNSGIMIHCQEPSSMRKDQDFPVSAEVQLLGGGPEGERPTANLCTPGTNVVMDGKLITQHCTNSSSKTYRGDDWVTVEVEVHGSGKVIHRVEGGDVLNYEQIQYDPNDPDGKLLIFNDKKLISEGWIALQSESHPVEFKDIEILVLPN